MIASKDLDFSFSGLKTAVLYAVQKAEQEGKFDDKFKRGLAREFVEAVVEVIDVKTRQAIEKIGAKSLIVGGGVSANHFIRKKLEAIAAEYSIPLFLPSRHISGDNALMIALAAVFDQTKTPRQIGAHGTKKLGNN